MDLSTILVVGTIAGLIYWISQQNASAATTGQDFIIPTPATGGGLVNAMAQAIAQEEGWNVPGSIAQRNNNPGNVGGPTATFSTADDGWTALENQINLMFGGSQYYNSGMSLAQVGDIYSNGDPNWAVNVASILGVSTSTTLNDLLNIYGGL